MKNRIELQKRLNAVTNQAAVCPPAFRMYCYDYYKAFYELCHNNPKIKNIYSAYTSEYNQPTEIMIPQLVNIAMRLPDNERNELLYHILVLPFYYLEKENQKERNIINDTTNC